MTESFPRPPANPAAPEVIIPPRIACGAGTESLVPVRIRHRGQAPAMMRVTVLGLDARWAPEPIAVGPLAPGEATQITLILVPERGALGARYPFAVAVEASPVSGPGSPLMGIAESTLTVDTQERIAMTIQPQTPVAVFGKKFRVEITNPGRVDRELDLAAESAHSASVHLSEKAVYVPAQHTVSVRGRVRVRRPTIVGPGNVHTFSVSARGQGAPEFAQASLRQRPLIRSGLTAVVALVAVVAVWVAAAIIFIPKISSAFTPKNPVAAPVTMTSGGPQASTGAAGGTAAGSAGAESSAAGSAGGAGGGAGGGGAGGAGAAAGAAGYQLAGTVDGPSPDGVTVSLQPTSLIEAQNAGATPAPNSSPATGNALRSLSGALGKVPADAMRLAPAGRTDSTATTATGKDGTFSFGGITGPGYYLLTLSMAGFQTQRFLVNSVDLAGAKPMKVTMVPGNGKLSGTVTSAGVPVGAAEVTLTDGTVSLQTSTVSNSSSSGKPGTWTVDGLSTPGNYLVTVAAPGYGTTSALVQLKAGGAEVQDIELVAGVASISGQVSGTDALGNAGGLGGISVTATDGKVTRTATTITTQPVGMYTLPNLPVPGKYTLTISGDGYQTQTQQVDLATGVGGATVNATLTRTDGVVAGTVTGTDVNGTSEGGLTGVGLILTGDKVSFKTMTTSSPAGGFRFTGIPPGTYVLTASQYGRVTASATVELTAAQSATANLTLQAAPNSELPATAHIRGQVVDSRTGGPLTCDRTAIPIPAAQCVVTVSVQSPVDPADATKGTETITATAGASEGFLYTVPALNDKHHAGLIPGLYRVTVSAPGYETSTTNVQVAQGQMAPAPQVSLPVLGIISGTVTTRVGTPSAPSCVVAVPLSTAVPSPLPTSCAPAPDGTTCAVTGLGQLPCGLTSTNESGQGAFGTYQIRGLSHGSYQMLLIPQDPEYLYVSQNPPIIQLELGGDGQFNAVLDRLGRVQLTTFLANRQTGALTPAAGAALAVTLLPSGTPHPAGKTLSDGTATITGLNGSYTVQAELSDKVVSGPSGPVGLNQTVDVTLVIAAPIGPVVGRITTDNGMDPDPTPVADATVTITGTVGYSGSSPISGTGSVTTDSQGCYAIIPAAWTPPAGQRLTSPACPSPVVSNGSIATMASTTSDGTSQPSTLKTDRISVAVGAVGNLTQGYPVTSTVITDNQPSSDVVRVIPTVSVLPQPVTVSPLTVTISGPTTGYAVPDLSTISIAVLNKPGLAGGVSITPQPTIPTTATAPIVANLTFSDTNLPSPSGFPGLYTLQVSLANFATIQAYLLCRMGGTCSFVDSVTKAPLAGGLVLKQYPSVSGSIKAADLPGGAHPDWTKATVSQTAGPAGLPSAAVVPSTADPDNTGTVVFGASNQTGALALPGAVYKFAITLPGYGPQTVTVTCGADFADNAVGAVNGCTPLTPQSGTLQQLPAFAGTLMLSTPTGPSTAISTARVAVTQQSNPAVTIVPTIGSTPNPDGSYPISWQDSSLPLNLVAIGSYALTFSAPGFQTVTASFSCTASGCNGPNAVTIRTLPQITGTITGPTDASAAVITPKSFPTTAGSMSVQVNSDGTVSFTDSSKPASPPGLASPGTYTFSIVVPGYTSQTVTVTCGQDYTDNSGAGAGAVNGCTPLDAALISLPTFSGRPGTLTLSATTSPYGDRTFSTGSVSAQVSPNPGGLINVSVGADGSVSWVDSSAGVLPDQIVPNGSTITFTLPGFQPLTVPVTCAPTSCSIGSQTLKMLPQGKGTVTIPLPPNPSQLDLTKAVITTTATNPASTSALRLTLSEASATSTTMTANLIWADALQPFAGIIQPDTYTVTIAMPGYETSVPVQVTCTYGGVCAPTIAVPLSPAFGAKLTINPPTLTTATLGVTGGPTGAGKVTLTADPAGDLTWQQVGSPTNVVTPGATPYIINATLPDYELVGLTSFSCTKASCVFPSLTLTAPTKLTVKFVDAADESPVDSVLATVFKAGTQVQQVLTAAGPANFSSQLSTTTSAYTLDADGAGYAFADGLSSTSTTVSCTNGTQTATGFTLIPGGTTTCTVQLAKLGTIVAQTNATMVSLAGPTPVINQLGSVAVTAKYLCAPSTPPASCPATPASGAATFAGVSGSSGALVLTGAVDNEGIKKGIYYVTAVLSGYTAVAGTVSITADGSGVYSMGASGLADALPIDTTNSTVPALQLDLAPKQATLQLHLTSGGSDILPPGVVAVTGPAGVHTCTIAASGTQPACVVSTGSAKYLTFANLYPGSLQLQVTPNPANYAPINKAVIVAAVTDSSLETQTATVPLSPFAGTLNGAVVVDATNAIVGGATVALWPWQGTAPANDFGGHPLTTTSATSDGTFTLSNIKPGSYELVVDATGYARKTSGIIVAVANSPIADQTPRLVRSARSVTLTLTSTATPAPDLTGAVVQLVQTSPLAAGAPADAPLTLSAVTKTGSTYTTQSSQVPTGTWTAQLVSLAGMNFLANGAAPTYVGAPFDVADPTPGDASPPAIAAGFALAQSAAQLTATWTVSTCAVAPANVQFTVTPPSAFGPAVDVPATISGSTATATVYVPKSPGTNDYSWTPKLADATVWAAQSKSFTGKASGTESSSSALASVTVPVTVAATVDGTDSPSLAATATAQTGTGTAVSPVSGSTPTTFCLPPGAGWTFSVKNPTATSPVLLPDQSGITVHQSPTASQNTITFAGYTLTPAVNLEQVTGRAVDSIDRAFSLSVAKGGASEWSSSADVTVSGSGPAASASGPALIVPSGSYKVTGTRTSPGSDVFADSATSAALDPSTTPTADILTATDLYAAAIVSVTVNGGPAGAATGATVSLTDGGTPATGVSTGSAVTTFYDLTPSKTYTATATWTSGPDTYVGAATVGSGPGGSTPVPVTVTLAKAPALAVKVLDSNGDPVAGASVSLYQGATPFAAVGTAVTTGADGTAIFSALTASTSYFAIATYTKTSKTYSSGVQTVTTGDASSLTSTSLTPEVTASVAVTVTWSDLAATPDTTGPAGGAAVTVSQHGVEVASGTADANGKVTIPGLAPSQGFSIAATFPHSPAAYTGTSSPNTGASGSTTAVPVTVGP